MPDGSLRDADSGDAAVLAAIKVAGWRTGYRGLLADSVLDALDIDQLTDEWSQTLTDLQEPSACLVVERDGEVAGYAVLGPYRWPDLAEAGEIYACYIDPQHWGRGLGRRLLTAASQRLEAAGFADQALWVLDTNQAGRRFYEALGWSYDGATAMRCEVPDVPEVRYRRQAHSMAL